MYAININTDFSGSPRIAEVWDRNETASKIAKNAGLGARLEAINTRLIVLGIETIQLCEVSFKRGWNNLLYTEENVSLVESQVYKLEALALIENIRIIAKETYQPKFEMLKSRAERFGIEIVFGENNVTIIENKKYYSGRFYSKDGLAKFTAEIESRELVLAVYATCIIVTKAAIVVTKAA